MGNGVSRRGRKMVGVGSGETRSGVFDVKNADSAAEGGGVMPGVGRGVARGRAREIRRERESLERN